MDKSKDQRSSPRKTKHSPLQPTTFRDEALESGLSKILIELLFSIFGFIPSLDMKNLPVND